MGITFLDVEHFDEILSNFFGALDEFGRRMRVPCNDVNWRWEGFIRVHCPESNDLINPMQKRGVSILGPQILCRIPTTQSAPSTFELIPVFIVGKGHEVHTINVVTHRFVLFLGG